MGLIAGIGQVIGSGISAGANAVIAKRQRRHEQLMSDKAYAQDVQMWDRQNEYNSPPQQMARLKAAGLNANLVYGNGTVGNTTGQMPKYQKSGSPYSRVDIPNIDYAGAMSAHNNIRKSKADADLTAALVTGQNIKNKFNNEVYRTKVNQEITNLTNMGFKANNERLRSFYLQQATDLMKAKTSLASQESNWMRQGLTKSDSVLLRQLAPFGSQIKSGLKNAWSEMMNYKNK